MGVRQKEGFTDTKRCSKLESIASDLISAPLIPPPLAFLKNQTSLGASPTTAPDQKCTQAILLNAKWESIDLKSQFQTLSEQAQNLLPISAYAYSQLFKLQSTE